MVEAGGGLRSDEGTGPGRTSLSASELQHVRTIGHVVRAAHTGLAKYFSQFSA